MDDVAAVELLVGAVTLPSSSGEETELANWLHGRLRPHFDTSGIDAAGNYVATIGSGPLRVYCLGHIDTVPGDIPVRIEDGVLWGRGSVDAKGSFCSHVTAVIRAFTANTELRRQLSVTLLGAVGEEAPHSIGARHAVDSLPAPDLLFIGEPSGWQSLTLGYKGQLRLTVGVACPESHSAGSEASAADRLLAICTALRAETEALTPPAAPETTRVFNQVQMTVTGVQSSSDGLQQQSEATVSFRLPPGVSAAHAQRCLMAAAARPFADAEKVNLQISSHGGVDAVLGDKDSRLSRVFRAAIRQHGGRPTFKVKTGTSDMNVVAPHWQVPVLAYGPGDSSLDHTPKERIPIADYLKAVVVTATALQLLGNA